MNKYRLFRKKKSDPFRNSLMSRYLLIVILAMLFLPIVFPSASLLFVMSSSWINGKEEAPLPYGNSHDIELRWHEEAKLMNDLPEEQIESLLTKLAEEYKEAHLFWVNDHGFIQFDTKQENVGQNWSSSYAVEYMKEANGNGENFIVVAFIGGGQIDRGQGFISIEMPRTLVTAPPSAYFGPLYYGLFMTVVPIIFILVSWSFFRRIIKRLIRLKGAISTPGADGIPLPVHVKKKDEIGRLEESFNGMVSQLRESQEQQKKEEQLRKNLIADLSHDLRTPLTVVRGHVHALDKEPLTENGKESLSLIEGKMNDLGGLIDNLLSYNLLASGKYTMKLEPCDVLRMVRESVAAWYPVWEKENFEIDMDIDEEGEAVIWNVDKQGFRRVLDNLFQNIVRHAKAGKYVRVTAESRNQQIYIIIEDHGPGMDTNSDFAGAGLGLSIVDLLLEGMGLIRLVENTGRGTRVILTVKGTA
ncbi:HAMP domain-containing sensor histidine kinase [Paenibacillus sp. Marseille-Q4541]|uniref:sensor histidine kinase n=1 Tax=Paenibacillus sp. Marseille-Q4541 TaxID=2831522 RepID=UPI001BAA8A85|nr:HAMP domain-containing sensor histidine kinase [Paenibacillus sp. Marseille-Q4541]